MLPEVPLGWLNATLACRHGDIRVTKSLPKHTSGKYGGVGLGNTDRAHSTLIKSRVVGTTSALPMTTTTGISDLTIPLGANHSVYKYCLPVVVFCLATHSARKQSPDRRV